MSVRLLELAARRGELRAKIKMQRGILINQAAPLERVLTQGDRVLYGLDWLKRHPAAVAITVAIIVVVRPRKTWRFAKRGFFFWRGWRALQKMIVGVRL